jgi:GNAT superfamily N-acetyltransferase
VPGTPADEPGIVIRRIEADEGPLLRDLRVRSLTDSPAAFGQSLEDVLGRPDLDWHRAALRASRGNGRAWLIAERIGAPVGLVQGRRRPPDCLLLFSMWVDPASRRRGVGEGLVGELEAWARSWNATATVLWVLRRNVSGLGFYRRLGFAVVDSGPDAEAGARYEAIALRRAIS